MVDSSKRPLKIPPRFVPYMETHRIYELFCDLARELVIRQPQDHILFLKHTLARLKRSRDKPRIIILAPPHVDMERLTDMVSDCMGVVPVTKEDIRSADSKGDIFEGCPPTVFAPIAAKVLRSNPFPECGWILVDFPTTQEEAVALQRAGLLPTHVIQLVPSSFLKSEALASEATISRPRAHVMDDIKKYRLRLIGLANTYKDVLQEVDVQGKSVERVVEDCVLLIRLMKHCGAPMLPRIVLLGPRGAGKRTQAKLLRDRFNLVHVEFDEVLRQALQEQSELGNILRSRAPSMNLESEHIEKILENRLLSWDCLARGWVLTEFPKNEKEFKILDLAETPPNRVIVLDVLPEECVSRVSGRRINVFTGSEHHLLSNPPEGPSVQEVAVHPRDKQDVVHNEVYRYVEDLEEMLHYAGETASHVDGTCSVAHVFEQVSACVIRPAPSAPPRLSLLHDTSDFDLEFEQTFDSRLKTLFGN